VEEVSLSVGSLFSGIMGIELGLRGAGKSRFGLAFAFHTIWCCEKEEFACAVIKKNFPGLLNLGDITKVNWNEVEKPDILTGGFPCQDISLAGKGKGRKEYAEAIRILRPKYALIENVPMLARRGLDIVLADLASCGYDAEWNIISAASVGAPHKRERMFIVAYPHRNGCEGDKCESGYTQTSPQTPIIFRQEQMEHVHSEWKEQLSESFLRRVVDGVPNHLDRLGCLGNAVVPACAQEVGEMILNAERRRIYEIYE